MCAGPSRRCGFVSCPRERNLRFLSLKPFLPSPLPRAALISTGRLADDLVVEAKTTGDNRWKPLRSCWAASWPWYTTVSTVSSSSVIGPCSPAPKTSSTFSVTSTRSAPSAKKSCVSGPPITTAGWKPSPRNTTSLCSGPKKGSARKTTVRPHLRRLERQSQFGVSFILKSMERGPSFRSDVPRFPVDDPHYRILARQRSRYTHYYFYIRDEVLGPIALCVGSFLPFSITYYLNGHHFIERERQRAGVGFRKEDNAFLWVADAQALQAAADRLRPQIIRQPLDHWTGVVGPKFSQKDRAALNRTRHYSLPQVEYGRNFVFRRNFPIHKLFERSCDLALFRLTADKLSQLFGFRLHQRIRGKLATVLDKDGPWSPCAARLRQKRRAAQV